MLAFLVFTAILISIYGALHHRWNKRNEKRGTASVPGMYPSLQALHVYANFIKTLRRD